MAEWPAPARGSLKNIIPIDVYFGRGEAIEAERERMNKRPHLTLRHLQHNAHAS